MCLRLFSKVSEQEELMQKKLLIPILVVLVLVIVLMVRGCGNKDASQGDKQDETQDVQTDTFDNTNTTGNDVRTELGTMTANESGGVDITVTADGPQTTYTYTDVAPDAWYADAVNYVVSTGVMSGDDTQHLFQPEYGVERSQFAVIMYRFAGGTPTEEDAEFSDLAGDEWYYEYVKWMVGKGLMGGNGGAFNPSDFLSCEQAIIVLYRLASEPTVSGTLDDYPYAPKVSESGRDAVTWAWNNGLITEKECVWYPTQAISRAQVALLLMRYDALIGRNAA